jgi:hypothetical protein
VALTTEGFESKIYYGNALYGWMTKEQTQAELHSAQEGRTKVIERMKANAMKKRKLRKTRESNNP